MGLLRIQEELAAILMEPEARKAFAKDPAGSLKARGVKGRDLALLASLVPDDLAYFAERRNVDRLHALRANAPRSTRLLESTQGRLNSYVRAYPYSLEDPREETDRFARWCKAAAKAGDVPSLLPDLAAVDAAVLRLFASTAHEATPSARPRRAPGLRLLWLGHVVGPALRSGDAKDARPGLATLALLRTADDVRWFGLSPLEATLLRTADGKRAEAAWAAAAAAATGARPAQVRKAARGLRADGLLAPRP